MKNTNAAMQIKLLLACRSHDSAQALWTKLVQAADGGILGEPTDLSQVLHRAAVILPDVLVLEHSETDEERTWKTLKGLGHVSAGTRALLLCDAYTQSTIIGSVRLGASGCLFTSSEPSLQVRGVTAVHRGESWFGRTALLEAIRSQIATRPNIASDLLDDNELLTAREREILGLIGDALSNKEIARRLQISDMTVKTHLHHIYVKLQQSGRYKAFLSSSGLRLH
jgi:DNA-binding NarL/FixJ family response regulator